MIGERFDGLGRDVIDQEGRRQTLGDVVGTNAAMLVFLRHFGCVGCDAQVAALLPRQPELADLGVRLVLIGSGSTEHARGFAERWGLEDRKIAIVTDPKLATFRAAGLERSVWATFGPRAIFTEILAVGAGQRLHARNGDRLQQGGTLVLDPNGVVVFAHANRFVGDHVEPAELVDVALRMELLQANREDFARRGIV